MSHEPRDHAEQVLLPVPVGQKCRALTFARSASHRRRDLVVMGR
jgi:hypothetical protein